MNNIVVLLLFTSLWVACEKNNAPAQEVLQTKDTVAQDSSPKYANYIDEVIASLPENPTPVMGYRFSVEGDFDGDGKKETLTEHFVSGIDGKETNKFYDSTINYDQLIVLVGRKEPKSFAISSNKKIDTLHIAGGWQCLGLSMLRNEGDLNGDGRDEISYVINHADWSSINTCYISTFTKEGWKVLHRFEIRDWQLPELPDSQKIIGIMGVEDINSTYGNDSINLVLTKELENFGGFVKKIKKGTIQVATISEDALAIIDTVKLPLKVK
jgi:hypothetical protein